MIIVRRCQGRVGTSKDASQEDPRKEKRWLRIQFVVDGPLYAASFADRLWIWIFYESERQKMCVDATIVNRGFLNFSVLWHCCARTDQRVSVSYCFHWGQSELISIFERISSNIINESFTFIFSGTLFSVGVFSHLLKIDDALIGVMSSMSKILSSFVYAFAVTDWQLYIAPIVEILNGTSFIAMRSIASKLVNSNELGKVNSLFGVAEALMPLLYAPMYTSLYAATLNTLPGAFFLLGGALTAPAVVIFL